MSDRRGEGKASRLSTGHQASYVRAAARPRSRQDKRDTPPARQDRLVGYLVDLSPSHCKLKAQAHADTLSSTKCKMFADVEIQKACYGWHVVLGLMQLTKQGRA